MLAFVPVSKYSFWSSGMWRRKILYILDKSVTLPIWVGIASGGSNFFWAFNSDALKKKRTNHHGCNNLWYQSSAVILLPLRPASLRYKNPLQRHKIIHGIRTSHRTQRIINGFEDFLVVYPVCVISVLFFLKMHIYVSLFCASSI